MSIFDRFFKSKRTAPPPPPSAPLPPLPAHATIESYVVEDAMGVVRLAAGGEVKFGRSACKGFEPVVGAQVILEDLLAHPRGFRAKLIVLDPADQNYDALLSARDKEHGLPARWLATAEAAATARQLGTVTVLLKDVLPEGTLALNKWATDHGFPRNGIEVRVERDIEFCIHGRSLATYAGRSMFPKDGLDTSRLPDDFNFGKSFVSFANRLPGGARLDRIALGNAQDVWGPEGEMRSVSLLIQCLLDHGTGIVLHRAGDLVLLREEFLRMLGDLEDPECRPFAAWLDVATTDRGGEKVYATVGMDAFGLPDVIAPVDPRDRWSRSRANEAVLYACYRMIRQNRELRTDEVLEVPLRTRVGAWPLNPAPKDAATISYALSDDGDLLRLQPLNQVDAVDMWMHRPESIPLNAYQVLLDHAFDGTVPTDLIRAVPAMNPNAVQHSVDVRARRDQRGFWIVTNGFGRHAVSGKSTPSLLRPTEFAIWAPEESFDLVNLVGSLASLALASTTGEWKPNDVISAPLDDVGIGGFLVQDGGAIKMGGGASVGILYFVPLAHDEFEQVRTGGAEAWLSTHAADESQWQAFLPRFHDRAKSVDTSDDTSVDTGDEKK